MWSQYFMQDLISKLDRLGKTYDSMFQAYEGHCVVSCGELANLEYLNKQEELIDIYLIEKAISVWYLPNIRP